MSGLIAAGIGAAVSIGTTIFGASKAKRDRRRAEKKAKRLNAKIEHLEKLSKIVEDNLSGFQRGDFEKKEVRETVAKVIVNQFKNYLKIY